MNKQLGSLLLVGGLIGAGYLAFNKITSNDLPLKTVRKVTQEIKHQMLIVSISFAEGAKQHYGKLQKSDSAKQAELSDYFRNKMGEIYRQKQDLILGKYGITKQKYSESLSKFEKDEKLVKMQKQIIDMMERAVRGEFPDLTVDARIKATFGKSEMKQIYEDMSKMILFALLAKLQDQKQKDRYFDSHSDEQFRKVIRELGIFDKKIEFFKQRGFKEEWGCPNQNFFKHSESLKIADPEFKAEMKKLEVIYERIVDIAAKDPLSLNLEKINEYYIEKPQVILEQKVEEPEQQGQDFLNLQTSTKSEPKVQKEALETSQKIEKVQEQGSNFLRFQISTKSEHKGQKETLETSQKIQGINVIAYETAPQKQEESEKAQEPQNQETSEKVPEPQPQTKFEDVPSDAHELQKEHDENVPQVEQKQESEENQPEAADSNASLDRVQLQTETVHTEPQVQNKEPVVEPQATTQNQETKQEEAEIVANSQ